MLLPPFARLSRRWLAVAIAIATVLGAFGVSAIVRLAVARGIARAASARGLEARWRALNVGFPVRISVSGLIVTDTARGDTVLRGDSLAVAIDPLSILLLRPAPHRIELYHARLVLPRGRAADPDTLVPGEESGPRRRDRPEKVKRAAESLVRALLLPARRMPRLELRDVSVSGAGGDGPAAAAQIEWLALRPGRSGVSLAGAGRLALEREVSFAFGLHYGNDDRIGGGARFGIPDEKGGKPAPLHITVEGAVAQDRRAGAVRIADSTRVTIGRLPLFVSGALERRGPALRFRLACDGVTEEQMLASLPSPVLGPLKELRVRGSWDYRLAFALDLGAPDSLDFSADVIPHGLVLDAAGSRLDLLSLDQPFVASIHLPRGRLVQRDLSPANPHFRPLEAIDSLLVHAVITNEDGGFFRHRGFNTEAVKGAIADNIRAGAFRRGAGTITMQLARNLWLGHKRTLSRKAQEVILAWVLEHLTWLTKQRMLEIYLNIIEWGPDVHGADEAARYYFDRDAGDLTVDQSLFLTTVIPAPAKWRYRFDESGALRPFERAQMHFIGRAMVAKGWLAAEGLPPADSLKVEITGPAREVLFPPLAAAADTLPI